MTVENVFSNKLIKLAFLMYLFVLLLIMINVYLPSLMTALVLYLIIIAFVLILRRHDGTPIKWGQTTMTIAGAPGGAILGGVLIIIIFVVSVFADWIQVIAINTQDQIFSTVIGIIVLHSLIAVGEELSFREYVLRNFTIGMGPPNAIILSSVMFSLIHFPSILMAGMPVQNAMIMYVTLLLNGILLAILYLKNGLVASIGFHFVWNFLQYNVLGLRSGFVSLLELTYDSPLLLTGGQYGPEAGLIGVLMMGVGIVVVLKYFKGRTDEIVFG